MRRIRSLVPMLLPVFVLVVACDERGDATGPGPGETVDLRSPEDASSATWTLDDAGRYRLSGDGVCPALEEQAYQLVDSNQECSSDADCTLHELAGRCITPLQCFRAFKLHTDFAALDREVGRLSSEYNENHCLCSGAKCLAPPLVRPRCDTQQKRCSTELASSD